MRKFFAVLLILIFIPLYVTIFMAFNLQAVFFDKELVKESLNEAEFYEKIAPSLIQDTYELSGETIFVTEDEILDLINTSIPPEAIKLETEKSIDALYPYLKAETDNLKIEYDITEYKKVFVTEAEALVIKKYDSLKVCTTKQLEDVDVNNLEEFPSCKVPGYSGEKLLDEVADGDFSSIINKYPDKIIVTEKEIVGVPPETIESETIPEESLVNIRNLLSQSPQAIMAGFAVLIAIIVLIALLSWRSYKSMAKWVGWTLLISSIIAGIFSYGLVSSASFVEEAISTASESATLAANVTMNLLDKMLYSRVIPQTIVIILISLALIIIPSFLKKKKEPAVPPQPPHPLSNS